VATQDPLPAAAQKALEGLADLAAPPPASWMPQTWGWAVIAAVLLTGLIAWAWRWRQRSLANRYRAEALRLLSVLESRPRNPETRATTVVEIAELVKRTALAAYGRPAVARLSGAEWLGFVGERGFPTTGAAAELLRDLEYRGDTLLAAMSDADTKALLDATRTWIKEHRVPA
jgi:hypothetical protein